MSSERYDEAVREQKKAERKKQVHKQIVILVIVLVVIAAAVAAVVFATIKEKDSQPKDKADISSTVSAIAASYEEFLADVDADASREDRKTGCRGLCSMAAKDVSKETAEKLQRK